MGKQQRGSCQEFANSSRPDSKKHGQATTRILSGICQLIKTRLKKTWASNNEDLVRNLPTHQDQTQKNMGKQQRGSCQEFANSSRPDSKKHGKATTRILSGICQLIKTRLKKTRE